MRRTRSLCCARDERPRRRAAEQRDELTASQWHSIPRQPSRMQDIELARCSQRVYEHRTDTRHLWNSRGVVRNQSAFAPESLTTLAHFSVSLAKSLAKSAGEPGSGVPPSSAIRAFILGSVTAALSS